MGEGREESQKAFGGLYRNLIEYKLTKIDTCNRVETYLNRYMLERRHGRAPNRVKVYMGLPIKESC